MKLLEITDKGIYCSKGDFYIDPTKKVHKAFITHGHSDHARPGHSKYICCEESVAVLKHRLGRHISVMGLSFGKNIQVRGVNVSFHPAGHIIGSAQIRVESRGEIWVVSGDYKTEVDGLCSHYEPIPCQHFITECTFGLPIFQWEPQHVVFEKINTWWKENQENGKVSIITAYSLGKAQRILHGLDNAIGKIYTHPTIENTNIALRNAGWNLKPTHKLDQLKTFHNQEAPLIIIPPTSLKSLETKYLRNCSIASASGWMAIKNNRHRQVIDQGFVLSDHADWIGLNQAIIATGAENIYPIHGYTSEVAQWLKEKGFYAEALQKSSGLV